MSFKKRRQNSHGTTMPTFIHRHHSYGIVATKSLGMDGWGRVGCLTHCVYSFTNTSARIQAHKTQTSKIHSRIYKIPLHLEHYTPAYLVEIIQPSCSGSGSSNEEYVCFKMGPRRSPLFQWLHTSLVIRRRGKSPTDTIHHPGKLRTFPKNWIPPMVPASAPYENRWILFLTAGIPARSYKRPPK